MIKLASIKKKTKSDFFLQKFHQHPQRNFLNRMVMNLLYEEDDRGLQHHKNNSLLSRLQKVKIQKKPQINQDLQAMTELQREGKEITHLELIAPKPQIQFCLKYKVKDRLYKFNKDLNLMKMTNSNLAKKIKLPYQVQLT